MPERVRDLPIFLNEVAAVLQTVVECRAVLFRRGFRNLVPEVIEPARRDLFVWAEFLSALEQDESPEQGESIRESLHRNGLDGAQLELKLESFEHALLRFEEEGGETNLQDILDRIFILLNSFAGAIPGVGPLAKELVDFFSKELRRRFRNSGIA